MQICSEGYHQHHLSWQCRSEHFAPISQTQDAQKLLIYSIHVVAMTAIVCTP